LSTPIVMGILNVTPDSFFAHSRVNTETEIAARADEIVAQGGTIIDVGGCSTRPGGEIASEQEEMSRLRLALATVRKCQPETPVSVDTFRPSVARMAVEEFGVDIINDVSEGTGSSQIPPETDNCEEMFLTVARLGVPYVLMSVRADLAQSLKALSRKVIQLHALGVKDILIDPGFGFGKTLEQNYELLAAMDRLQVLGLPLLVGVSRKRMAWQPLGISPGEALNASTVLHTVALLKGASIIRTHDVKEAVEACRIVNMLHHQTQ